MNPATQVTELHGKPILELVDFPFAATCLFSITKEMPTKEQVPLINALSNYFIARGTRYIETAVKGRENGCTPNAYLAPEIMLQGTNPFFKELQAMSETLSGLVFEEAGHDISVNEKLVQKLVKKEKLFAHNPADETEKKVADYLFALVKKTKQETIFTQFAQIYIQGETKSKRQTNALSLAIASILMSLSWKALIGRSITKETAFDAGIYLALNGVLVGTACTNPRKNKYWAALHTLKDLSVLETDYTTTCFQVLFNRDPEEKEVFALNSLLSLTTTNGPGTLSAKGAKESVSAKNNIATAFAGFMLNTGIAHGGNGFEAVAFLIKEFGDLDPYKINQKDWEAKTREIAIKTAQTYLDYKKKAKSEGNMQYMKIPCVNHPVFKNKPINIDPREEFIWNLFEKRKTVNPFQVYYHQLVKELYSAGATKNVFCVNIDAVIATISLELFWQQMKKGEIQEHEMQNIVFTMFLFGRMAGTAAEIADHLSRGTDMDCRTPASQIEYVR